MALCNCGCGETLTGKQKRFKNDDHRARYWSNCRKAGALGKGLDALMRQAAGCEREPISGTLRTGFDALLPKQKGAPHCGHPSKSTRLRLTLEAIKSHGGWISTLRIQEKTRGVKVSTDIDDLRRAGYPVSMAHYSHTTLDGRKVYLYKWEGGK